MKALQLQVQNFGLYAGMAVASGFLFLIALGPGVFSTAPDPFSWQYQVFDLLCHQDIVRSYLVGSSKMAVCSRCFGIYSFFFLGWFLMPLTALIIKLSRKWEKKLLAAAILINLVDVIGNQFGIWTNTLNSRFLLGSLVGLTAAFFLTDQFFKRYKSEE